MGKIGWGQSTGRAIKPKLTVEVVRAALKAPKATKFVATIATAYFTHFAQTGDQLWVEFKEFEGYALQCNKIQASSFRALASEGILKNEQNDNDELAWEGVRIPMVVQMFENPNDESQVEKWVAVHPDDYQAALAEWKKAGGK